MNRMFNYQSARIAENSKPATDWRVLGARIVEAAELATAMHLQVNARRLASTEPNGITKPRFEER